MNDLQLLINDQAVAASNGATFERHNPMTGAVATRAAAAGVEDAKAAADAAQAAFPGWAALGPGERRMRLLRAADILAERVDEFVAAMMEETGSTAPWAQFNVHLASNMLREAGALTTQVSGEVLPSDKPGTTVLAVRQPVGVVVGIAPWNAPVILGVRAIATPLACGNTVILKASEICPKTHHLIGDVLSQAGLGKGVVNIITNDPKDAPQVVDALIAHPAVRRINFTGSTRVGRIIAETAARHLKPALLELGGKAPLVVLDDANLDHAVNAAIFGSFMHQGQICMSTERLVVDESVADEFVRKFAERANALTVGDPAEGKAPLGSVVDQSTIDRCMALIEDAVGKGARLVAGGKANGTLMQATVLDGVTDAMRIYYEESFGPMVCVIRGKGVDDLVRLANDTEYGLASAVFGHDVTRAIEVAKRIDAGICHINGPTVHDEAHVPFGGTKNSGYGRFGGKAGIAEFTELRQITIEQGGQQYPF